MSLKRTPIRKVSDKRAKELRIYSTLRKEFLREKPVCEVCYIQGSTDVHHRAKRTGGNFLKVDTWMATCRSCHEDIHRHPSKARLAGYLI